MALPNERKESTNINYRKVLRKHIYAAFAHMRLDQIKRKDIKFFFDGLLTKGLKPSGFCSIKTTIKSVLQHAVDSEIIETNCMAGISVGSKAVYKVDPLTEEEAALLLEVARQHKDGLYYPPLLCALRTGMRIGELQALEWDDVDFEMRLISVTKSNYRGTVTSTKNKKIRKVDMSLQLAETLRRLKLEKKKLAFREGKALPSFVFADEKGRMLWQEAFRRNLNLCLKRAGLRPIRIHDLRHTYATIRLLKGHNIGDVSYQLGHSSISITYDVYGHWMPGKFKAEVDELDVQFQAK